MRVLISSGYLGGAGGAERALFSILHALAADEVDLLVGRRLGGPLGEVGPRTRVSLIGDRDWRWRGAAQHSGLEGLLMQRLINPFRRKLLPRYDVYLQFSSGMNLATAVRAAVKLLIPAGNAIPVRIARYFDFIAMEAPDNEKFIPSGMSRFLLPPPVLPLSELVTRPQVELPPQYFLTVFNPYGSIKGTDDLVRALDSCPHPIVWCHSQQTLRFEIPKLLVDHPRVVHVDDPTPAELKYLYENANAYLAFSKTEGFGWAIADALRYSRAVVSRRVGVLSYPQAERQHVIYADEPWNVDWSLLERLPKNSDGELAWLSPARFRARLVEASNLASSRR